MGTVYEGVDQKTGRRAALKVLLPEYASNKELTGRLFREARALGRLHHPGIVEVFDYGETTDGTAYLAMEYLSGQTLSDWHSQHPGPVASPMVLSLGKQLASALAMAHEKGVVHRDVKPSNVLVQKEASNADCLTVKLLDFGIAKLAQDTQGQKAKTATNLIMGTPYYMSPEQCQGAGYVNAESDVYSLGVLLFELLSGELPFDGKGSGHVLGLHMFKEPPHLRQVAPQVPGGLADLVNTLLAKEPEQRPSMRDLAAELDRMLAAGGAPAASPLARTLLSGQHSAHRAKPLDTTLGSLLGQSQFFHRRRSLLGVAAVGLAATIALVVVSRREQKYDNGARQMAEPPRVRPTVRWLIGSTPPGAHVVRSHDGQVLGQTPWQSQQDSELGELSIVLRYPGYKDAPITLDRGISAERIETLIPLPKSPGKSAAASSRSSGNPSKPVAPISRPSTPRFSNENVKIIQ